MEPNNNNNQQQGMNGKPRSGGKGMWIAVLAIIIIGLVIIFAGKKDSDDKMMDTGNTSPDTTVAVDNGTGVNEEDATSPAASLSYQQALVKYKGKIIQFTANCQAIPDKQTFKLGTSIMLDNRAPKATTVKLGSTYTLGGYGFRIVTLNTVGTFLVDCGTSQNVSTVSVQK